MTRVMSVHDIAAKRPQVRAQWRSSVSKASAHDLHIPAEMPGYFVDRFAYARLAHPMLHWRRPALPGFELQVKDRVAELRSFLQPCEQLDGWVADPAAPTELSGFYADLLQDWGMSVRTVIERGPKDKRAVAFSIDWPGWSRGAKSADVALETLESYRDRYRPVASLAGLKREFSRSGPLEIVEEKVGTSSTDFWGISFLPSLTERDPMDDADLERGIKILQACWAFFDDVAARVSPEMRKGPRGGGRDRDRIIGHTILNESQNFAKQVGLRMPEGAALTPEGLRLHRVNYIEAMRAYNAGEVKRRMRSWTLPFLIRHSAFHTLDHAWEMEDKDLSGEA